jgi:hypothetical protein
MREVKVFLTDKMDAAVEAFKEIWKEEYSEEEVVKELLKNGIEHYMESIEKSETGEFKIITEIMEGKGYKGKICDME